MFQLFQTLRWLQTLQMLLWIPWILWIRFDPMHPWRQSFPWFLSLQTDHWHRYFQTIQKCPKLQLHPTIPWNPTPQTRQFLLLCPSLPSHH